MRSHKAATGPVPAQGESVMSEPVLHDEWDGSDAGFDRQLDMKGFHFTYVVEGEEVRYDDAVVEEDDDDDMNHD